MTGQGDVEFLKAAFQKLLLNFTWWVNRKDRNGRNVFEGGFLGLDNIGVFDRSSPLPTGGYLEQADGTAWMALFSQNMLSLALELACHDPVYEDMAAKFGEHFLLISAAIDRLGEHHDEMWDEEDGFFYDVLRLPDGNATRLKVRSMVGLLPFCAVSVFPGEVVTRFPRFMEQMQIRRNQQPDLWKTLAFAGQTGAGGRRILSLLDEKKLRRVLSRLLDENEFLSPYGVRALSRYHAEHPYVFRVHGEEFRVGYLPGDSDSGMFGGNSNWRGPIWFPVNALIVRALLQYYSFLGNDFTVECPTGSGRRMNLFEVAREIGARLTSIFLRDPSGRRPVYGTARKFQEDPHWRECILFYEYFHGDSGSGIGASHQTGWTGLVAKLIQMFADVTTERLLAPEPAAGLIYRGGRGRR
ncbi:MAG: MGH1-like glycoside hydrolase domain-containing protein, partial [Verrucomicrobiota bacterium]